MTRPRLARAALAGLILWLPVHAAVAIVPATDAGFCLALESSVHGFGTVKRYDQVMPPRHARLLRNLANGSYDCREEAERSIREIGPANLRLLAWGSYSRDAEVAARCRRMIAEHRRCPHCNGSGVCPVRAEHSYCGPCIYRPGNDVDLSDRTSCLMCLGSGDSRFNP